MASVDVERILQIYKSIAQYPTLTGTRILEVTPTRVSVQSSWTQRNLERCTNQKFVQTHLSNANLTSFTESFPIDTTTELLSASTDNQQQRAILRQVTVENTTKQFIEIWNKHRLIKNYDLAALDMHKDVYIDSEFATFEWSLNGTKLLYIAEKKLPKSEPFYKQKCLEKKDQDKNKDMDVTIGNEYIYKPHWGERLVGKHRPVIAILDVSADTIVTPSIPDDLSPGQLLWTTDDNIVGVVLKHEPRYLGLVACTNRLSWIFLLKDGEFQKLSANGSAVHSPRLSPNGKYLIWLEREAGGPHHDAQRLMYLNLKSEERKPEVLIDRVSTSITINHGKQFYGLYDSLPKRCWSNDSKYVFLSTPQEFNIHSYVIDINSKMITEILNENATLSILDVKDDVITFSETSVVKPWQLTISYFKSDMLNDGCIPRLPVTMPVSILSFRDVIYDYTKYTYDNDDEVKQFNFTYFGIKHGENKSVPFIVVPHGGPHTNFINKFSLEYSLLVLLGFAVLKVNYRGSTGMGSANVRYLQGRVGNTDVQDCVTATKVALEKYPWLDSARIGLFGGSHGGFLVTHLSGQYPNLYKAVVARNPVIDVAAMFTISDIPDCRNALTAEEKIAYQHDACTAVINRTYDEIDPQNTSDFVEMFSKMLRCSPIMHVDKVKCPTLICIGTNDLRVPPSQGKLWYHRLKANNIKTRMLVYEDSHPLASGPAEIDCIINACLWLMKHTFVPKE